MQRNKYPERCKSHIFSNGKKICIVIGRTLEIDNWVKAIAKLSSQQVDWCYKEKEAHILYIGDYLKVYDAIIKLSNAPNIKLQRIFEE